MKYLESGAVAIAALSSGVVAFPSAALEALAKSELAKSELDKRVGAPEIRNGYIYPKPEFDAKAQYISTKGQYKWVAPGPSDARGPCPGLNAMANHNYLPHNGIATIAQFTEANYVGFGMGRDLSGFLAVYGAVFDGNLEAWSIGGPSKNLPVLNGLLGTPTGISGSHNKYENDASPIRGDLYKYGNDYLNHVDLFQQFIDIHKGVPDDVVNYDLLDLQNFRSARFDNSIATNPYFFNGPFSGAIASAAAYTFIYRLMANKSAEFPEGRLNRANLMKFYSMTGKDGAYVYTPGHERFPENWYKRAISDPYTIPFFALDAIQQEIVAEPKFISVGGNTGKVNSFAGFDPLDLSGGVYRLSDLKDPKQFQCFFFQFLEQAAPDLLEGIFTDVTPAMDLLGKSITKTLKGKTCKKLQKFQYGQFGRFPGYSKSYDGYTP